VGNGRKHLALLYLHNSPGIIIEWNAKTQQPFKTSGIHAFLTVHVQEDYKIGICFFS
jgi:hypothetical protein